LIDGGRTFVYEGVVISEEPRNVFILTPYDYDMDLMVTMGGLGTGVVG
jgi:hypothetical protein